MTQLYRFRPRGGILRLTITPFDVLQVTNDRQTCQGDESRTANHQVHLDNDEISVALNEDLIKNNSFQLPFLGDLGGTCCCSTVWSDIVPHFYRFVILRGGTEWRPHEPMRPRATTGAPGVTSQHLLSLLIDSWGLFLFISCPLTVSSNCG